MVLTGVSFYGKTPLRMISKSVKVNSDYYINSVLKLFLNKNVPRCFNGHENVSSGLNV